MLKMIKLMVQTQQNKNKKLIKYNGSSDINRFMYEILHLNNTLETEQIRIHKTCITTNLSNTSPHITNSLLTDNHTNLGEVRQSKSYYAPLYERLNEDFSR